MDFIQIVVLALVQGLTEFLPISSSAHLILVPEILHWPDQGLAFDISVHVGTLAAIVFYLRQEILRTTVDWGKSLVARQRVGDSGLAWAIIITTIPVIVIGFVTKDFVEESLRSPLILATTSILFGLLLWWADIKGTRDRDEHSLTLRDMLIIGFAQAIALIPGTSRSGITITAALMLGLNRQAAARFSFLLSIPTILGAGVLATKDLIEQSAPVDWGTLTLGVLFSAVSAYTCIFLFMKWLDRMGMGPYVIYRILLGIALFVIFW
ncbi:MAG: undecaprenyl-diphosphate phosphatase [Gammaproteobacteria bacterium]|nr:undecaprenyl-diphosphate phosphatase [Gammaproteobacteria bacterium]